MFYTLTAVHHALCVIQYLLNTSNMQRLEPELHDYLKARAVEMSIRVCTEIEKGKERGI